MPKLLVILIIFLISFYSWGQMLETPLDEDELIFSGRISRINPQAKLIRIRSDYANLKFLNRQDRLEFWNESYPDQRCLGSVEGRTNDYLLLKIPEYSSCIKRVHFTTGSYLHFTGTDLGSTVRIAKELVEILMKKRLAISAKKNRHQRELDSYVEMMDAVNKRYEILRQKLEIEWKKELSALEEDKANSFVEFKSAESSLIEIDTKLERYRVHDNNLKIDRWSLDPALYIKK
jgi:hypothetical protein